MLKHIIELILLLNNLHTLKPLRESNPYQISLPTGSKPQSSLPIYSDSFNNSSLESSSILLLNIKTPTFY